MCVCVCVCVCVCARNVDNFQCIDRIISIRSSYSNLNRLSTNGERHVSNLKPHLDACGNCVCILKSLLPLFKTKKSNIMAVLVSL